MVKKNSKNNNSTFPVHILLTNFKSSFRFSEEIEMEQWNIGLMILLKLKKINENCGFGHIYSKNPLWKTSFFVKRKVFDLTNFLIATFDKNCTSLSKIINFFFIFKNLFDLTCIVLEVF